MKVTTEFSDEQRTAMAAAMLDLGLSAEKVVDRAQTGSLAPDMGAFRPSASTVRRAADQERQQRQDDPDRIPPDLHVRVDDVARRAVTLVEHAAEQLEQQTKTGPVDAKLLTKLEQLLRLVHTSRNMLTATAREQAANPRPKPGPGLLDELVDRERLAGKRVEPDPAAGDVDHDTAG